MSFQLQMLQEEEDSLEAAMEGGGSEDLHREEEDGEDTRGLTRSALGPAVGETSTGFQT